MVGLAPTIHVFRAAEIAVVGSTVIPGWSEGPDPESRDSGFDALHRPGMTAARDVDARDQPGHDDFFIDPIVTRA
jgi:hypothetical protein